MYNIALKQASDILIHELLRVQKDETLVITAEMIAEKSVVGNIIQDQLVLGSNTWGFGSIGAGLLPPDGIKAPSHSDGVCLNTTLEVDGAL